MNTNHTFVLRSIETGKEYPIDQIRYRGDNGELLEVHNKNRKQVPLTKKQLEKRKMQQSGPFASGVWRYKEFILPLEDVHIISKPEGNTNLYSVGLASNNGYSVIGKYTGIDVLYLKHEGENPTGSFKDRGMTVGASMAHALKATAVACASTGNTSASLASYAAQAGMKSYVFIPEGKISYGKLSQSMAYGAVTIQIKGDFDMAMHLVEEVCLEHGIYLLNSINPFRIEGQKTIAYELLQQLNWNVPDWLVLPAGNLGNTSAIGKGLRELKEIGFINKVPRIASIQAEGANPFYTSFMNGFVNMEAVAAETVATAIRIGNPVSFLKAKEAIVQTDGIVEQVTDQELLDAKAIIDRAGIGCEPASATTVAGIKKLKKKNIIKKTDVVAGILTGHILKDPDTTIQYHRHELAGVHSTFANKIHVTEAHAKDVARIITGVMKNEKPSVSR